MKSKIHPQFFEDCKVTCSCGNTFLTGSTKQHINVEACYKCHPFFTGEERFLDVRGRVDDFKKKIEFAKTMKDKVKAKKEKKNTKSAYEPKSLKELLGE